MIDANQRWGVSEAISWVSKLSEFRPLWIEEPTSPDDILGHAAISKVINKCRHVWNSNKKVSLNLTLFLYYSLRYTVTYGIGLSVFQALAPLGIGVATGEQVGKCDSTLLQHFFTHLKFNERVCIFVCQCHNRVMFKQFLQASALQFVQIDSCRVGSVNENLAIILMAAKFKGKICM